MHMSTTIYRSHCHSPVLLSSCLYVLFVLLVCTSNHQMDMEERDETKDLRTYYIYREIWPPTLQPCVSCFLQTVSWYKYGPYQHCSKVQQRIVLTEGTSNDWSSISAFKSSSPEFRRSYFCPSVKKKNFPHPLNPTWHSELAGKKGYPLPQDPPKNLLMYTP
jgi:hypothetical protein